MKLYKRGDNVLIEHTGIWYHTRHPWDTLVDHPNLHASLLSLLPSFTQTDAVDPAGQWDAPIGSQEIWAAGVTYFRSREARMEEAKQAGGGDFYDRVYHADRPELFYKSSAFRASGNRGKVRIRKDSTWNVPEPELTLFLSSRGSIEGYTIGNDMSSRSIEGENPLYLPQAKTYDGSASIGPCLWVRELPPDPESGINLQIVRDGNALFEDATRFSRMKRKPEELASWLFRECSFPHGCYLMTGTGIVPPDDFTLLAGDEVRISIDGIGTLVNFVS
jgi:2-dehydro-3-deoxy-D-arabinonate dehydratase